MGAVAPKKERKKEEVNFLLLKCQKRFLRCLSTRDVAQTNQLILY
jgi:hypothetical protein